MSEEYGPSFITLIDDDGQEIELEYVDALEYKGQIYMAFLPVIAEDEEESEFDVKSIFEEEGDDEDGFNSESDEDDDFEDEDDDTFGFGKLFDEDEDFDDEE